MKTMKKIMQGAFAVALASSLVAGSVTQETKRTRRVQSHMTIHRGAILASLLCALVLACNPAVPLAQNAPPDSKETIVSPTVLVELFTSEGCSTCPPADKLLSELDHNQAIKGVLVIAMSEHVDYWDRLGWKDPFSSAQFTQRQREYAQALHFEDIYTPQMIVDGRTGFVGSKGKTALEAIAEAARTPKAIVRLAIKESASNSIKVSVQVESVADAAPGDTVDVMLAIAESGLSNKVSRGENSGRELGHSSVVRKLIKIGKFDGQSFSAEPSVNLDRAWKRQQIKAVVFVQLRTSRRVLGAAQTKIVDGS